MTDIYAITLFIACYRTQVEPQDARQRHRSQTIRSGRYVDNIHHVFPPLHELLVDDFASIVFACLDVYGLLDDSICTASKRTTCAILQQECK